MLYKIYQLVVCLPLLGLSTLLTALLTIVGCTFGKASPVHLEQAYVPHTIAAC